MRRLSKATASGAAVGAALLAFSVAPAGATQFSYVSDADRAALHSIARSYFQERADRVTNQGQKSSRAFGRISVTSALRTELDQELRNIEELRGRLRSARADYSKANTAVNIEKVSGDTSQVTVQLHERTKLYFAHPGRSADAPKYEEYILPHTMTFRRHVDGWQLTTATVDGPADQLLPATQTRGEWRTGSVVPPSVTAVEVDPVDDSGDVEPLTHRSYNRTAMKDYAWKWALDYNPNYRKYSNDCTNFMSQAVRAGGWSMVNSDLSRSSTRRWNYGRYTWTTSYSWAAVDHFRAFGIWSGRTQTTYLSQLRTADIVHIGVYQDGSTDWFHSMMVTYTDRYGAKLVSYHTTNTRNRSLSSVREQYSASRYRFSYRHT